MSHVLKAKGIIFDMSHPANVKRLERVVRKLHGKWLGENVDVHMYQGDIKARVGFHLPRWRYGCAIDEMGEVQYDPWGTSKVAQKALGQLYQEYASESVKDKALMNGWTLESETKDPQGVIQLVLAR